MRTYSPPSLRHILTMKGSSGQPRGLTWGSTALIGIAEHCVLWSRSGRAVLAPDRAVLSKGGQSLRRLGALAREGTQVMPRVDGLGKQVTLLVESALADLVSAHRFVEGPSSHIGAQHVDLEH